MGQEIKDKLIALKELTLNELLDRLLDPDCPPALFATARGLLKDNEGMFKDQPPTIESLLNNLGSDVQTTFGN